MAYKLRHECERCGLAAEFERAGRFRDEDFYELLQDYFALEHSLALWRERHSSLSKEYWALMDQFIALDVERYQRILDEAIARSVDEQTESDPFA